jgi:hypothetical protein
MSELSNALGFVGARSNVASNVTNKKRLMKSLNEYDNYIMRFRASSIFGPDVRYTRAMGRRFACDVPQKEPGFNHRNAKHEMRSMMRVIHSAI